MKNVLFKIIAFTFVVLTFGSCITAKKVNYLQKPGFDIPSYPDSMNFKDYRLRVGDRLYVKVYSTDEKSNALFNGSSNNSQMMMNGSGSSSSLTDLYTYLVKDNGTIEFPMLGNIEMKGLTVRQAKDSLEKALIPILKYCTVDVRVVNRSFSVIGSGKSVYLPLPQQKINIFKALAMAGDIGIYGDKSKIKIIRETNNGVVIKQFDLRSRDIIHSQYYYIEPNDVIYIQTINDQFFSITSFPKLISTVFSTISFAVFLYDAANVFVTKTGL